MNKRKEKEGRKIQALSVVVVVVVSVVSRQSSATLYILVQVHRYSPRLLVGRD